MNFIGRGADIFQLKLGEQQNGSIKVADPVLVTELLLQLSVDLLNVIQIIHIYAAIMILLTHCRAVKLFCQGLYLHLQVWDLGNTFQTTLTI